MSYTIFITDGELPAFSCPHCDRAYGTKKALQKHVKKHTDAGRYTCQFCDFTHHDRGKLRKHCALKHSDKRVGSLLKMPF